MYLSLMPGNNLPKIKIPNIDKAVHFIFYFTLVFLMAYGWQKQKTVSWMHSKMLMKIFFVAICYGCCIEMMQEIFTTTRHFDWLDIMANTTGSATASLITVKLFKL